MHAGAGPRVSFAAAEGAVYRADRDVFPRHARHGTG